MDKMIKAKDLSKLIYFFECYFNISADYLELDELIDEYKQTESREFVDDLKGEITLLLSINDIKYIRDFIKKYGMRNIQDDKKIISILNHIKNGLDQI